MLFLFFSIFCIWTKNYVQWTKSSSSMETAATAAEWKRKELSLCFVFFEKKCYVQSRKNRKPKKKNRKTMGMFCDCVDICSQFSNTFAVKQGRQRNKNITYTRTIYYARNNSFIWSFFIFWKMGRFFVCWGNT